MLRALCFSLLLGCSAPPPPPPAPVVVKKAKRPDPPPPAPPRSPLFVLGWTEHLSDKTPNPTTLCAIEGALFVCGTGRVVRLEGDDLIHDDALEGGLLRDESGALHGSIHAMLGRYPDDAWLVMKSGLNIGTEALYRRAGSQWTLAKKWKIESVTGSLEHLHWKPGKVAVLANSLAGNDKSTVEVVTKAGAAPMPALPAAGACPQWLRYPSLGVAKDGSLVLTGTRCDGDTPAWLRLAPGKAAEKRDGTPDFAAAPPAEYAIVSSNLVRRTADGSTEEIPLPPPPVADASTLVPFQVIMRSKNDYVVAARFKKERMTGVAILRTTPAKNPAKL